MAQLGKIDVTLRSEAGATQAGVVIEVRKRGATVNGSHPGATTVFTVNHPGAIETGDNVAVDTGTTSLAVTGVTETTVTIAGPGFADLIDDQRLTVTNNLPSIFLDSNGDEAASNPLAATGSDGSRDVWALGEMFDLHFSGGSIATILRRDVPAIGAEENVSHAFDFATGVGWIEDTLRSLTVSGAKLKSQRNAGVEKWFVDKDGRTSVTQHFGVFGYGAVGDGVTDDIVAIQAAAYAAATAGGGTVVLPGLPFKVSPSTSITLPANVSIRGSGPQTSIFRSGATTADLFLIDGVANVEVSNLTLHQTNDTAQFGLVTIQGASTNVAVRNCVLKDGYAGVWIKQGTRIKVVENDISNLSHNVYIGDNVEPGGGDIESVIVANNDIYSAKTGGDGIKTVKTCHDLVIDGNSIHENALDGIDMFVSGDRVAITGNTIYENSGQGIDVKSEETGFPPAQWGQARDFTISGNLIRNNTFAGISVVGTADGQIVYNMNISDNVILENAQYGIIMEGPAFTIGNNVIARNGTSTAANYTGVTIISLVATDIANGTIVGNVILNNGETSKVNFGININNADNILILGNVIDSVSTQPNNFQDNGINLDATSADTRIIGNYLGPGATTAELTIGAGATYRCQGNVGIPDQADVPDVASAAEISLGDGDIFNITGTTTITSIAAASTVAGRRVSLKFADILTFTDGSNLKLAGDFVTTADDTIRLECFDGTNWFEATRSTN